SCIQIPPYLSPLSYLPSTTLFRSVVPVVLGVEEAEGPEVLAPAQIHLANPSGQHDGGRVPPAPRAFLEAPALPAVRARVREVFFPHAHEDHALVALEPGGHHVDVPVAAGLPGPQLTVASLEPSGEVRAGGRPRPAVVDRTVDPGAQDVAEPLVDHDVEVHGVAERQHVARQHRRAALAVDVVDQLRGVVAGARARGVGPLEARGG